MFHFYKIINENEYEVLSVYYGYFTTAFSVLPNVMTVDSGIKVDFYHDVK